MSTSFLSFLLILILSCFSPTTEAGTRRRDHSKSRNSKTSRRRRYRHYDNGFIGITVPNAQCLFGAEWTYAIRPGDPRYLAIIFRGGFACNSESTCTDDDAARSPLESYFNDSNPFTEGLPLNDYNLKWTVLMLPSCNKDVNLGSKNITLNETSNLIGSFTGGLNIKQVLNDILSQDRSLEITRYVNFDIVEHIVLWGSSSGSLVAAIWGLQIFEYVSENSLKTLILDGFAGDSDITSLITLQLDLFLDIRSSPAYVPELEDLLVNNDLTLESLVGLLQSRYCELFVSSLFFEYDTTFTVVLFLLTGDTSFFDPNVWSSYMLNNVLPDIETFDQKRSSFYVTEGNNHVAILPEFEVDVTIIGTDCVEDPALQEYLTNVIGDRKSVRKYYGEPELRVKSFPQKSWNNLLNTENSTTCLQCYYD